jgi:alkanesulfonate monooxygenase SsuD/methylene tetrahydromethanopterin reductase-like flavin-dependent oxidoreductase (luciferase family)
MAGAPLPSAAPWQESPMDFHMHLLPTDPPGGAASLKEYYQQILEQVAVAEDLGWKGFWFTEHHFRRHGGPVPNPMGMMCAAAARTSRIRLGSGIAILPLHHPIQLAEDYAMVDVLSGGRLEFGIGQGNAPIDFHVYGIAEEEKRPRFEEALEVIQKAWSHERLCHHGPRWSFTDVAVHPAPLQRPTPPFWVAGRSRETLGWAGRLGFNIMTVARPQQVYDDGITAWKDGLAEAGLGARERRCKLHLRAWVDEDAERAADLAQTALARYRRLEASERGGRPLIADDDGSYLAAGGRNVYGDPDQCIRLLKGLQTEYYFNACSTTFNYGDIPHELVLRAMRLFARKVMPAFDD